MSADEYVPSDTDVRSVWVVHERDCGWAPHPGDPSAEFERFLARIRRDAAREALDGLIKQERKNYAKGADQCGHVVHAAEEYRDARYPEETDR